MENENFVENLGAVFSKTSSVKNVYGEPIRVGEKTIIPVASIAYGFGGGFGHGTKATIPGSKGDALQKTHPGGEGAGGGGGIYSRAKGVYEITAGGTRFIPVNPARYILTGIAIGFLLKHFFFSKGRKK